MKMRVLIGCVMATLLIFLGAIAVSRQHRGEQDKRITSSYHPFGSDSKDIRYASKSVDDMADTLAKRINKVANECDRLGIKGDARKKMIDDTYKAGVAAMRTVKESHYTVPFVPKFPPLPQ